MSLYNRIIDLQKLHKAWDRVRKNKPAAGVDYITYEQFEENKSEELKKLNRELKDHSYSVLPVKLVKLYKDGKEREIALYSMRDKVVQQSVSSELNLMYDTLFSSQSFAYRNNKSALDAVNSISEQIEKRRYQFVAKLDILHYFDTILWENMLPLLKRRIKEDDVLELIEKNVRGESLDVSGELVEKWKGIYQGSAVSPILSNIYLMEFDHEMARQPIEYVRYSDDILILAEDRERLQAVLHLAKVELERRGLAINERKSVCAPLEQGADFLGYHFSAQGKSIPAKAEKNLSERLEMMWLTSADLTVKEKFGKALEIIGGWEQYFREQRLPVSVIEYAALVYAAKGKKDYQRELMNNRSHYVNIYKDITVYLAEIWQRENRLDLELLEYEQFYQIWSDEPFPQTYGSIAVSELVNFYRKEMIGESRDHAVELMQLYTDMGQYEKAQFWSAKKTNEKEKAPLLGMNTQKAGASLAVQYTPSSIDRIMKVLVGREDLYSKEVLAGGNRRSFEMQAIPLSKQAVIEHLKGKETLGTYIQRSNATVHYIVVDVDISKKIMLQYERESSEYQAYLEKARNTAGNILKLYHEFGLQGYVEYSGCRGYHVWLFFSEWIPTRYANMFCEMLEKKLGDKEEEIHLEFFPNKTRIKPGKLGQVLKLPYGVHSKTGEQSYFLDVHGNPVEELDPFLDGIATFSVSAIKKVLQAGMGAKEMAEKKAAEISVEEFGTIPETILEILSKCSLMRYLCHKALKTCYLTHFERLSVLYVFGHMGESGREFVHQIMSYTLNYQYNVTERFIQRIPAKPVSCIKLREQYKMITAEYGCNCNFRQSKNCYPSPVLHAISRSSDLPEEITLPTSRTVTDEKAKKVIEEMNIHKRSQELASRILEFKKQKRGIDAAIHKVEKELERIYDNAGIDCLEVEMGLLVRRKTEHGYEWLIEI